MGPMDGMVVVGHPERAEAKYGYYLEKEGTIGVRTCGRKRRWLAMSLDSEFFETMKKKREKGRSAHCNEGDYLEAEGCTIGHPKIPVSTA
jgi:hypothetical protein